MTISVINENKNTALANNFETKTGVDLTWADMTWTWEDAEGTWAIPKLSPSLESKNSSLANNFETKN